METKPHIQPKPEYITPLRLTTERGWTKTLITRFLGDPDKTAPNPMFSKAGAPMRLYCLLRVLATEESAEWKQAYKKAAKRSQAALESAERQADRLMISIL
jgi:hypothetical protein